MHQGATANYDELLKSGAGRLLRCKEKAQSAVRTVLQARFGSAPTLQALMPITNLRQLDDLLRLAATVENLEEFETALTALIQNSGKRYAPLAIANSGTLNYLSGLSGA